MTRSNKQLLRHGACILLAFLIFHVPFILATTDDAQGIDHNLKAALLTFKRRTGDKQYNQYRVRAFGQAFEKTAYYAGKKAEWQRKEMLKEKADLTADTLKSYDTITDLLRVKRIRRRGLEDLSLDIPEVTTPKSIASDPSSEVLGTPDSARREAVIGNLDLIDKDVARSSIDLFVTDPAEARMMEGGLAIVLRSLAFDTPDIGYSQGMNLVATQMMVQKIDPEDVYAINRVILASEVRSIWNFHNERFIWQKFLETFSRYFPPKFVELLEREGLDPTLGAFQWLPSLYTATLSKFGAKSKEAIREVMKEFFKGSAYPQERGLVLEDVFFVGFAALFARMDTVIELAKSEDPETNFMHYILKDIFEDWVDDPRSVSRDVNAWRKHVKSVDSPKSSWLNIFKRRRI